MPHLELLVEELSMEEALKILLPRIVGSAATHRIHVFEGKPDLLRKLPNRLRAYARFLPEDWRIVVLVDRDSQECRELKAKLDRAAATAGLATKTAAGADRCRVLNRIAIEELEAWFFGDAVALRAAFPGLPSTFEKKSAYRDPDAIRGGTFERLARLLQGKGYYPEGVPKIELAREVAKHMEPERNRSLSFAHFRDGIRALCD